MNDPHSSNTSSNLTQEVIENLKIAASNMSGSSRRKFQAEMTIRYCEGNARKAEELIGWSRDSVQKGLHEIRTGIVCLNGNATFSGKKRWEDKHPEAAQALWDLAQAHSQQDPTFRTTIAFTRLTAKEAISQLIAMGFDHEILPSPSSMADILNRNGYRLRTVIKAKPLKKIPETDAIFTNIKEHDKDALIALESNELARISVDCKATVKIGDYSRGGMTRGDNLALDHDMGCEEKYTPFGVVNEDTGDFFIFFGSSYKTSDFIVDGLYRWWENQDYEFRSSVKKIQIKVDNGPESSGTRTQFLSRIIEFSDYTNTEIQLLYYPPYHSKYNPIERCWGVLEKHWNGAKLINYESMIQWAESMTWKGIHPIIELTDKVYEKGISITKKAMRFIEERLIRNPVLPKWDILIKPAI